MKKLILILALLLITVTAQATSSQITNFTPPTSSLTPAQKAMLREQIALSRVSPNGYYKGILLAGRVKVVEDFPDFEVKVVNSLPDLCVLRVDSLPQAVGEWQFVDNFEDFSIKFVDSLEDFSIQFVDSLPGVN